MRGVRQWMPWGWALVAPFVLFIILSQGFVHDPSWEIPNFHFFIVSLTSLISLFLACLIVVAAGQLRDARIVFLSLAFLSITGIFAVHGLTTPGALFAGPNPWVGFSARLSLFLGALFFAFSAFDHHPRLQTLVVRHQTRITTTFMVALVIYGAVAVIDSAGSASSSDAGGEYGYSDSYAHDEYGNEAYAHDEYGDEAYGHDDHGDEAYAEADHDDEAYAEADHDDDAYAADDGYGGHDHAAYGGVDGGSQTFAFLSSPAIAESVTVATVILLFAAILHYGGLYRRSRMPMQAGFLLAAIFLLQAEISMAFGTIWQASWWQYHILMLAAFVVASFGLVIQYGRSGSVQGVIEGLLARTTIERLQTGYTDVIVALVAAVEAKDVYTRGHTQRVSELALRIGEDLGLPPDRLRILGQSAMLHDIGKIGVPDSILNKPGKLTDNEFAVVQLHPLRGYEMVKNVRSLRAALSGIRHHHERLDGSGYPDGLCGDAISLDARIIAVADVYDALTSERSYRTAWTPERAMAELQRDAGTRLDASCVAALRRVLAAEQREVPATALTVDERRTAMASAD